MDEPIPRLENLVSEILSAVNNLIMIHSIQWRPCSRFLEVTREFLEHYASSGNVILALNSAHHALDYAWSQRSIGNECDPNVDTEITTLVKKAICCYDDGCDEEEPLSDEVTKAKS